MTGLSDFNSNNNDHSLLIIGGAWRSGNALGRFNEVTPRRARLVLGWVTVYGQVSHLSTKPAS